MDPLRSRLAKTVEANEKGKGMGMRKKITFVIFKKDCNNTVLVSNSKYLHRYKPV